MSSRRSALETFPIWVRGRASMSSRRSGHFVPWYLRACTRSPERQKPSANAQANSACRSTLGSGAPGSFLLRPIVTVTRASATDRRETGARFAHLTSV
jgi:hypothetical protein